MSHLVQQKAPSFTSQAVMQDGTFKQVSLEDYRGKYVLLFIQSPRFARVAKNVAHHSPDCVCTNFA